MLDAGADVNHLFTTRFLGANRQAEIHPRVAGQKLLLIQAPGTAVDEAVGRAQLIYPTPERLEVMQLLMQAGAKAAKQILGDEAYAAKVKVIAEDVSPDYARQMY